MPSSAAPIRTVDLAMRSLGQHYAMAALFSGVINLLYLSSPLYLMQVYNRVLVNENIPTLLVLTAILVVALMTMAALDAVRAQMLIRCGIRLDSILAPRVFDALVRRSARRGSSQSAQQLRELDQFRTFVTGPGIYFAFDVPWIPIYLLLLFLIHPLLGLVATIGAVILLGVAVFNEMTTRNLLRRAEAAGAQSYVFTENILRHADVVRAMGMQPAVERNWLADRSSMLGQQAWASDKNAVLAASIRFLRLLLQAAMLGTGAWLAIDRAIMPATIFAASIVLGRALVPVEQAVGTWRQFVAAREGYRNVSNLLAQSELVSPQTILPREENALIAEHLRYSLPSRKEPVIKDLSFEIPGGTALGIAGPSGSGKSTLARLLVSAIAPQNGKLRFGGIDYSHWDANEFGRNVGYLPQDVGLFAGTVRENIARFGEADTDEIIAAAKMAGIHEMILDLPKQYDTVLGAGGVGLSGGQRQRLALARALLGIPPLLVLDEPNANLDSAGEDALKCALIACKEAGSTIVVVTHRVTILEAVDALMVVRDGRLEAIGPPTEVYASLKRSQGSGNQPLMSGPR